MARIVSICIPTRAGDRYRELFLSLKKSFVNFTSAWQVEILIGVNGADAEMAVRSIKQIADSLGLAASCQIIDLSPEVMGKSAAMNKLVALASGEILIFLDDDVVFERNFLFSSLMAFIEEPNCILFGCCQKIIRPISGGRRRNFIYDIVNIQQIAKVFTGPDPFLFGRFLVIKKQDMPVLPLGLINDDMYLNILFYPRVKIYPGVVCYQGTRTLRGHFFRVLRLMKGRKQMRKYFNNRQLELYASDRSNQRRLDWQKIFKLSPYFFVCFILYRVIRLFIHLIISFYLKFNVRSLSDDGWARIS